ncbi:MAG: GIY-YIG nuclease family protein [Spirulina sp. SIO3F2]|nr:GIY-YIG nuclease family protein [Spirulina sp. SIO3F2]
MINPENITPTALPSVPLPERKDLPAIAGIYFAIDSQGNVQYIGRSVNIQQRWTVHHRTDQLKKMRGVKIAYLTVDDPQLLDSTEEALIEWFDPPLNGASVAGRTSKADKSTRRMNLYIDERIADTVTTLSEHERRSVNAQVEMLLIEALVARGILKRPELPQLTLEE